MNTVGVETSQHVQLSYEPATLLQRMLAWLIDGLLFVIYIFVVFYIIDTIIPTGFNFNMDSGWITIALIMTPYFLYHPLIEMIWNGRSVGKKALGIQVRKMDGSRATIGNFLIRWIFRFFEISAMGGVVAILTILINGKGQRLGDIAAGTSVIKEKTNKKIDTSFFEQQNQDQNLTFPQVEELSDEDINVIKKVLYTNRGYDSRTRSNLLTKTRGVMEKKLGAVDEAQSDENYLLTILRDYNSRFGSVDSDNNV